MCGPIRPNVRREPLGASRSASVLILVLWSLAFLTALSVAVATYVRTSLTLADRLYQETRAEGLARLAVAKAIAITGADTNAWDALDEPWAEGGGCWEEERAETGKFAVYHFRVESDGTRVAARGLADEERRIHLNRAPPELLAALFETAAGLAPTEARERAAAVAFWRTPENPELTADRRRGYYARRRPEGYRVHHGLLDAVEELLLIEGFTEEIYRRIEPWVTVWGSGVININTAEPVVLRALAMWAGAGDAEMARSVADKIARARQEGVVFRSKADVAAWAAAGVLSPPEGALFRRMAVGMDVQSTGFRGEARGIAGGTPSAERRIIFGFERSTGKKCFWYEF